LKLRKETSICLSLQFAA